MRPVDHHNAKFSFRFALSAGYAQEMPGARGEGPSLHSIQVSELQSDAVGQAFPAA
jgi:hypothetical protein